MDRLKLKVEVLSVYADLASKIEHGIDRLSTELKAATEEASARVEQLRHAAKQE